MKSIGKDLGDTHTMYLKKAQSALEQARQEYRRAEEEIDANGSLFHHIDNSRIELRSRLSDNIRRMKDLVGPRRRLPDEVWSLIFWERVTEDEEAYGQTWRDENPPFTTLKLTWVCRLWRQIVSNQPSLWRYITLPQNYYLSTAQVERFNHFKERLKGCSPKIYMVPGSVGGRSDEGGVYLKTVLRGLPTIGLFEAHIIRDPKPLESFLTSTQLQVEELALF